MAQIFHRSTNLIARVSILGAVFIIGAVTWALAALNRSPYVTQVGVAREQPVPFSHKHHVKQLGIDCRYCHTSVEESNSAGIPPTETCMTCHSQIHATSPMLEPVRESWRTNRPIPWTKVYDLPDFVYFDHSIHVKKGVACVTCHGPVDEMPLVWKASTLHMEWCLECHRKPELYVRPREYVFRTDWVPSEDQRELGRRLVREYRIDRPEKLTDCSVCHR
ncbi:MAG: cytochrome c family protein [Blastocatellia bacterium]|nr:cytochrome c family protein [Blastocatellia bacterium]MCS7157932.1 cytochrome c family protein [Blastocatellia bacterium]MCX7752439.1 cytochrome c family protein [Blastocatellia bacterium]MDW8167446.1 cytochrome c3 family protein [Acidobacteriota bacterium]MDW8257376.1 cytochrome c3 family protein [Acidobacteriota bacterium]